MLGVLFPPDHTMTTTNCRFLSFSSQELLNVHFFNFELPSEIVVFENWYQRILKKKKS